MPMVGKKKFAYTVKGKMEAEKYASKTGKKMHERKESKAIKSKEAKQKKS